MAQGASRGTTGQPLLTLVSWTFAQSAGRAGTRDVLSWWPKSMTRRAFMMIKKAFDENSVKIAYPTVHVDSGGENLAAAQQMLKMKQAAELAASQPAAS